jgi:hypothetical protein
MQLHHGWRIYTRGPASLAAGILCLFSPQLLAMMDREFIFGDWVGYVAAAVFLIGGVAMVVESFRPLQVRIDAEGIAWRKNGHDALVRWTEMTRVAIEKAPNSGKRNKANQLTVWTTGSAGEGIEPDAPLQGLSGFRVVNLDDVKESTAEIEAALRHFAAGRYQGSVR